MGNFDCAVLSISIATMKIISIIWENICEKSVILG